LSASVLKNIFRIFVSNFDGQPDAKAIVWVERFASLTASASREYCARFFLLILSIDDFGTSMHHFSTRPPREFAL
jgi:hypothetical protein